MRCWPVRLLLAFEQDPAGLRRCGVLSFGSESADVLASSFVDGLAQDRNDIEAGTASCAPSEHAVHWGIRAPLAAYLR
jgi:hypothetical protein